MPADFPEAFARVGWEGIEDEMRAHKDTIKRWMIDHGEEQLQQARRAYLEAKYAAQGKRVGGIRPGRKLGKRARYVMGRTLKPKKMPKQPRFWDMGLIEAERAEPLTARARMLAGAASIVADEPTLPGVE
ncbi:hypothetical protein [Sphingomonas sp.]|uniref:hypothetical protein n=1 Tax=Sphingomonas sp. TaxID=28214 RepID=UPI0035C831B8